MRKLGLVSSLWAALLLFPWTVFALGLGDIEVSSYLNQPLKAQIKVISARPGEIDDLLISLASRDAFNKAGLERPAILSRLKFKVKKSSDGKKATVFVTTRTPVKEPFLSFLVEADWAKGRLLREFTVLLDPPSFAQQSVSSTPLTENSGISQVQSQNHQVDTMASSQSMTTSPADQAIANTQPVDNSPSAASNQSGGAASQASTAPEQIVVAKGDTLWRIASQFKDDNHSMAQVMLALQMMNPDAFGHDNINNLKVGAVLRVPELNTLNSLSKREAYAQVLKQNGLWDEYVARKTGAATGATVSPATTSATGNANAKENQGQDKGKLSLLAPGKGNSENASLKNDKSGEDTGKIRKQLALAEEQLEAARLENKDLSDRVKSLEKQLSKFEQLKKMIQIKDNSLAQLQNAEAEKNAAGTQTTTGQDAMAQSSGTTTQETSAPAENAATSGESTAETAAAPSTATTASTETAAGTTPATAAPSETMVNAAKEMMEQDNAQPSPQQPEAAQDGSVGSAATTNSMEDSAAQAPVESETAQASTETETATNPDNAETTQVPSPADNGDQQAKDSTTVPAPAIITEAPASTTSVIRDMLPSVDDLLKDPVMLGGIGGVLALIIGALMLRRKKSSDDTGITVEEPSVVNLDDDATPIHVPDAHDEDEPQAVLDDEDETDIDTAMLDTEKQMAQTQVNEADETGDDEFAKTAVVDADELAATEEIEAVSEDQVSEEQDDVLNEVDVYLAYGLYDNAEDLLKESLDNHPERADYRAKLLDTYFATKNKDAFVKEAEILKSLGGAADRFWARVQTMGFELAPENDLFSGGKDSPVSIEDLEYAKPETPDFDIGADEDETAFSSTDFDLGDDLAASVDGDVAATQVMNADVGTENDFLSTQSMDSLDMDFPDLDEVASEEQKKQVGINADASETDETTDDDPDIDFSADLDLSEADDEASLSLDGEKTDEVMEADLALEDDVELSFELPEDGELTTDDIESVTHEKDEFDLDSMAETPVDELVADLDAMDKGEEDKPDQAMDEPVVDQPSEKESTGATRAEATGLVDTIIEAPLESEDIEIDLDDDLDFDMSDIDQTDLAEGNFSPSDTVALEEINQNNDDITEFRPAELAEDFDPLHSEPTDPEISAHPDISTDLEKTGTFAPGDFNDDEITAEDEESLEDITDIEELMLPDDVDEIATKLDLAKAFIDMGDAEGARSSLEEVLIEGNAEQKAEASGLLEQIK